MFTGDWLYMLFMHQACVFETKEQYVKSNEILTAVVKEALLKGHINDILLEEEVPTSSASWSSTLTSLLNTPLRSCLQLP
jgi:hypothetical protein